MEAKRPAVSQNLVTRVWRNFGMRSGNNAMDPAYGLWKFPCCLPSTGDDVGSRSCSSRHVPRGVLSVYVGRERKKFVIPARYVNHPAFKLLLEKAKEEYGFSQKGALTMPCEVLLFQRFLLLISTGDPPAFELDICELEKYYLDKYHICVERISMDD